jgi:hypothetical protein
MMTTNGNDNESGRMPVTVLHLIYRIVDGRFQNYGLFETRREAERDLALISRDSGGWQIAEVPCIADLLGRRNRGTEHPA